VDWGVELTDETNFLAKIFCKINIKNSSVCEVGWLLNCGVYTYRQTEGQKIFSFPTALNKSHQHDTTVWNLNLHFY